MKTSWQAASVVLAGMAVCAGLSASAGAQDARRRKKLIATGWDHADSERLLKHHKEMEKRPFDGVVVHVRGHVDEKRRLPLHWMFLADKWQRKWFEPCVANLRRCKFRRFTDNFILVGANPGKVDWFDDAGWREVLEHWRIAAWVAKASGFKGIVFDPEPYAPPHAQFKYAAQPQRGKHTFNAYHAKARQRGREVMQAVVEQYPDLTLLCYFMNIAGATGNADPRRVLGPMTYGLYPAFIDGWLDAAPPGVTFVDGCESAYRYNSAAEYLEAGTLIKGACQELVSPENRAKYRAQVQVGFGVYLDAYWNPKDSKWGQWYVDGLGGPRVKRLRINVQTALRVADEYVWIYGEKFRWWPTPNGRVNAETWPEALPGCEKALRYARDPVEYARAQIAEGKQAGKAENLARNGDFSSAELRLEDGRVEKWRDGRPPAGWGAWQEATSKGTFTWDRRSGAAGEGSAKAANVRNGCFIQRYPAEPGERFAVRAARRLQGKGRAWIRIRWQTSESKWTAETQDRVFYTGGPREKWSEIFGVVEVPDTAGQLVILLGVGDQAAEKDAAWFDDVELWGLD